MEIKYNTRLPLVKIPQKVEFTLFLIREELKSRKFTNDLEKIGFDSVSFPKIRPFKNRIRQTRHESVSKNY